MIFLIIMLTSENKIQTMFGDQVQIGEGAYATVYKARIESSDTEDQVAVKKVDKHPDWNVESVILSQLEHPNIISWIGCYETPNYGYIITEYVAGCDLFDILVEYKYLTESFTKSIFIKILSAVKYLHDKGYAHLDLKPENILIGKDERVKLVDFGFSKQAFNNPLTKRSGSPEYISPEIIQGSPYRPNPCDIWALGVTLYLVLYGNLPFRGTNSIELYTKINQEEPIYSDKVSSTVNSLISGMLVKNPDNRLTIDQVIDHPWLSGY